MPTHKPVTQLKRIILSLITKRSKEFSFILILFSSCLFYLININFSDISVDELFTQALVRHSFIEIPSILEEDVHPPLYFLMLKIFTSLFGISLFTIRLFSVIGVLATLILVFTVGKMAFTKSFALYLSLLLSSLPILVSYAHDGRMYTWAAFSVTGVFLGSYLFIKNKSPGNLICIVGFSLMAAYTHYFGLIAAVGSMLFVFMYFVLLRMNTWRICGVGIIVFILLYIPWISTLVNHYEKVQDLFWVPDVTPRRILACLIGPFSSYFLAAAVYGVIGISVYRNFIKKIDNDRLAVGMALFIFGFTIFCTAAISFYLKPILTTRYMTTIAPLIMVPPALFFCSLKVTLLNQITLSIIVCMGVFTSFRYSRHSSGPYHQAVEFISSKTPLRKLLHFEEASVSMLEYETQSHFDHYWLSTNRSFTNLDVFYQLHKVNSLGDFLKDKEVFGLVYDSTKPLNKKNVDNVLSRSEFIRTDTIIDNKVKNGSKLLIYILKYKK